MGERYAQRKVGFALFGRGAYVAAAVPAATFSHATRVPLQSRSGLQVTRVERIALAEDRLSRNRGGTSGRVVRTSRA